MTPVTGFRSGAETVTSVNVDITPDKLSWRPFTRELRETADKLKADGWQPQPRDGELGLDAFVAQDSSRLGSSDSGAIAWFDWSKGGMTPQAASAARLEQRALLFLVRLGEDRFALELHMEARRPLVACVGELRQTIDLGSPPVG